MLEKDSAGKFTDPDQSKARPQQNYAPFISKCPRFEPKKS